MTDEADRYLREKDLIHHRLTRLTGILGARME